MIVIINIDIAVFFVVDNDFLIFILLVCFPEITLD